jgi:hypothetical protein
VVRDLNPKNELHYLRVRAKKHEIMVAYGEWVTWSSTYHNTTYDELAVTIDPQFIVIITQKWSPAGEKSQ